VFEFHRRLRGKNSKGGLNAGGLSTLSEGTWDLS